MTSLAVLAGCGGDAPSNAATAGPQVVREMDGDTAVVRTVSGSVWGGTATLVPELEIGVLDGAQEYMFGSIRSFEVDAAGRILVLDAQVPELRVFAPDGTWLETWGRSGEGPGEFGSPDGGLALLSDGRVVIRDPGNARLQIYGSDGRPLDTWPVISGGFSTSTDFSLWGDSLLNPRVINLGEGVSLADWRFGFEMISPDGEVVDTIEYPDTDWEEWYVQATSEDGSSSSRNTVPWAPQRVLTWHPDGYFIDAISDRYAFTLLRPGAPLRIEREVAAVPVTGGEKNEAEALTTQGLRYTDPNWRWNGPSIPDMKPPFDEIHVARDGRIWVQRELEGVEGDDPNYDPSDPESLPDRWRADVAFDVFEADGTFLGSVDVPSGLSGYPAPIFDGDQVWAVTRDDYDVQRIVRYGIRFTGGS